LQKAILATILVVYIAGGVFLGFRGERSTAQPAAEQQETLTVTDFAGRQVTLRQPIRRIVLMRSFFMYELATVLGDEIDEKLVGWDSSIQTGDRDAYLKFVERFPRLAQITVLGDSLRDAVSPEAVLALKPDLVIMDTYWLTRQLKSVEQMERAGLPLVFLVSRDPFSDLQKSLLLLGKVLGKEEKTRAATQFIDAHLNKVMGRLKEISGAEPSIYLEAGGSPQHYGNAYGSARRGSLSWGSIMAQLRCRNITAEVIPEMGPINPEYLLKADPDVIVLTGANWTDRPDSLRLGYYARPEDARRGLLAFTDRPGWAGLKAVKNRRLYGLHMRFSSHVTSFFAAEQLARWLYPAEFNDVDPERSLREFHERFMPIGYSGSWKVGVEE
jgi:iron complex transport system substrate-binding protein